MCQRRDDDTFFVFDYIVDGVGKGFQKTPSRIFTNFIISFGHKTDTIHSLIYFIEKTYSKTGQLMLVKFNGLVQLSLS